MSTHTNENDPAFPGPFKAEPGLTAREHAAITLRVPMSGNPWLDEMITEARRWDAAQAAMPSYSDKMRGDAVANSINDASALVEDLKGGAE